MFKILAEAGVLTAGLITAYFFLVTICAFSDRCSAGW